MSTCTKASGWNRAGLGALLLLLPLFLGACDDNPTDPDGNGTAGADTLALVAEIPVGSEPLGIAVAGDYWVVANHMTVAGESNTLMVIDPATLAVIDTADFTGNPEDIVWVPGSGEVWVSDDASRRVRIYSVPDLNYIDTATMQGEGDPDWYGYPAGLIYDSDNGGTIWGIEEFSGYLTGFSPLTAAITDTFRYRPFRGYGTGFSFPTGISLAVDTTRDLLFIGNIDDRRLEVVSTATMTKVDSLVWDPGYYVNFVFADPVNGHIMVNERTSSFGEGIMRVYDMDDLSLYREVSIPDWPDYGGIAWVTEGAQVVLATGNTLTEFSTPDYTKLTQTTLPANPVRVAYDATREYYLVTFRYEDMVRVYQVPE